MVLLSRIGALSFLACLLLGDLLDLLVKGELIVPQVNLLCNADELLLLRLAEVLVPALLRFPKRLLFLSRFLGGDKMPT